MENVRLTVPVSGRAHSVFSRIAEASGVSLGRCMSSWLDDTLDAAEYMADKMLDARTAPRILARELHGYAAGLQVAGDAIIKRAQGGLTPPSSNTGGKVSGKLKNRASK